MQQHSENSIPRKADIAEQVAANVQILVVEGDDVADEYSSIAHEG
jgi:hypothetical protein